MNSSFKDRIINNAKFIEQALAKKLSALAKNDDYAYVKGLCDSMEYSLMAGGKRLRPCLVLEFARLFGASPESAIDYACSLEMIHTFSLIHDDMPCMDNDDLRRGKPTNHVVFGEPFALLAGDALIALAFETLINDSLSPEQNVAALRVLSHYTGVFGMCGGQQIDLENEGKVHDDDKLALEILQTLHDKKTGALIKCACLLGCIAAGLEKGSVEYADAAKFATLIGLAFQVRDDVLDVIGDTQTLGKNTGSDTREQKITYVSLMGIEKATEYANSLCNEATEIIKKYPDSEFLCELAQYVAQREN